MRLLVLLTATLILTLTLWPGRSGSGQLAGAAPTAARSARAVSADPAALTVRCPGGHWTICQTIASVFTRYPSTAVCVAFYESTLNPRAWNAGNAGLFQINLAAHPWVDRSRILGALYNTRVAYRISNGGRSWAPWSVHRLCGV